MHSASGLSRTNRKRPAGTLRLLPEHLGEVHSRGTRQSRACRHRPSAPREGDVRELVRPLSSSPVGSTRTVAWGFCSRVPSLREILVAIGPALEFPLARHLVDEQAGVGEDGDLFIAAPLQMLEGLDQAEVLVVVVGDASPCEAVLGMDAFPVLVDDVAVCPRPGLGSARPSV